MRPLLLVLALVLSPGIAVAADCIVLDDFSRATPGELPAGWKLRKDSGRGVYTVREEGGRRFLAAVSDGIGILLVAAHPRLLDPIDKGQIVLRMIHNLRRAYLARGSVNKAIEVMDLLIRINPRAADEYRNRGMLHAQGQNMTAARDDFERYLQLAPNAEDKQQVQEQLQSVRRWLASLN